MGWIASAGMFGILLVPNCEAKKPVKTISTPDGRPIRKVYIRTASQQTASSVTTDLTQDTCLTTVSDESQADAVLNVGMNLPRLGGLAPQPNVFVPSATGQTMGNSKMEPQRTASVNCSNGKEGGCTGTDTIQGGDLGEDLPPGFGRTGGSRLDVSLISTGKASQQLWQPDSRGKRSWSDQLRRAAGCPVCPGEHFRPHKKRTYREWIQAKCPSVLAFTEEQ
jgi:hypothetical protein